MDADPQNIPPRHLKSTLFGIIFPAWLWTRDPSLKLLTGAYLTWPKHTASRSLGQDERVCPRSDRLKFTALRPEVDFQPDALLARSCQKQATDCEVLHSDPDRIVERDVLAGGPPGG